MKTTEEEKRQTVIQGQAFVNMAEDEAVFRDAIPCAWLSQKRGPPQFLHFT